MIEFADVIVDLQQGDSGKGKVTHYLALTRDYNLCMRYNGGGNAGHTIHHNGKKIFTHYIPSGIISGMRSVIGPGCVLNVAKFFEEKAQLEQAGIMVEGLIKIAKNVHITTSAHIAEDSKDVKIGTCKTGNGQTYRDKYARTGIRAEQIPELAPYLVDIFEELHCSGNIRLLCEGAQGYYLDIIFGDYPYVTSSHCTVGGAIINGVPWNTIRRVYGLAKVYETYVGAKQFQPSDPVFKQIAAVGKEYGVTTGRTRQCNWLNIDNLNKAIKMNGVTNLIFNKADILCDIKQWGLISDGKVLRFQTEDDFIDAILARIPQYVGSYGFQKLNVTFSYSPEKI